MRIIDGNQSDIDDLRYGNFEGFTEIEGDQYKMIHSMFDNTLTWKDVTWLTSITKLPVIAKGIITGMHHQCVSQTPWYQILITSLNR